MKKTAILSVSILLSSCTSTMVKRVYEPHKGGVVKYLSDGASFVVNKRLEDAYNKMEEFCGGGYTIIAESDSSEFAGTITNFSGNGNATTNVYGNTAYTSGSAYGQSQSYAVHSNFTYISFRCNEP